jgi:pyruvate kinase
MIKKTKIVATIGPATEDLKTLERLILIGMDVARLNFSHGSYTEYQAVIKKIRYLAKQFNKPLAILQDLCGPKIRIGDFYKESIILKSGQKFILTNQKCVGNEKKVFINYKNLYKEIRKGERILLNDGKNELIVEKIVGNDIYCQVVVGGEIRGRRGVNLPDSVLKISSLTNKDKQDIQFGIKNNVDFIAISFVRKPEDILELKKILRKHKAQEIKIVAKIETREAIYNIDAIIDVADAIMVARGDLAIEVGVEQVPILQKRIIQKSNNAGKPVITATQMLESMINSPMPTRAEVNDIANAILDGTDAVMLSEETALGRYPLKAVEVMARVARHTEKNFNYKEFLQHTCLLPHVITDSVCSAVVDVAYNINAATIVTLTESGFTARMISRYKPKQVILALTPSEKVYNQLALSFGCYPQKINKFNNLLDIIKLIKTITLKKQLTKKGDVIVISAGIPFGQSGATNFLIAQEI